MKRRTRTRIRHTRKTMDPFLHFIVEDLGAVGYLGCTIFQSMKASRWKKIGLKGSEEQKALKEVRHLTCQNIISTCIIQSITSHLQNFKKAALIRHIKLKS
jgi:hypothetical protein